MLAFAALNPPTESIADERYADTLTFYRPGARFPRRRWEDSPGEPPPVEEEKPLTPTERALYLGFAVWVGFTFLALFVLIILLHSPTNAN